jgi:hypothetical protein
MDTGKTARCSMKTTDIQRNLDRGRRETSKDSFVKTKSRIGFY